MDAILARILYFQAENNQEDDSPCDELTYPDSPHSVSVSVAVIAFSKERPYQLHQLLRSIYLHLQSSTLTIKVIYVPGDYEKEYEEVFSFYSAQYPPMRVEGIRQTEDFHKDLRDVVEQVCSNDIISSMNPSTHILFAVDDLIFIDHVDLTLCAQTLNAHPSAFTLHLKLHPGIIYSHAANKHCLPPVLKPIRRLNSTGEDVEFCKFELAGGKVDWRYPFDLCASLYRSRDIHRLIQYFDQQHMSISNQNPNRLETFGNQVFWKLSSREWSRYQHCLCSARPLLTVITINQVQNTYKVPIYRNPLICTSGNDSNLLDLTDLMALNRRLLSIICTGPQTDQEHTKWIDQSTNLDLNRYRYLLSTSVHIGDVYLLSLDERIDQDAISGSCSTSTIPPPIKSIKVTILLPIFNGEKHIEQCFHRVLTLLEGSLAFHLLVIDDGSTDGTRTLLEKFVDELERMNHGECQYSIIYHSENQGLADTLDEGLRLATTEYVARIDVDDEILPQRLETQIVFLDCSSSRKSGIHVVGSQAVLVKHNSQHQKGQPAEEFISNMPCHPMLVDCSMYFNCAVLHPSVCFRREIVLECGGYKGSTDVVELNDPEKYIEDYCLWLRILERYPLAIANLPHVGVIINQHNESKSLKEAKQAREARISLLGHHWWKHCQEYRDNSLDLLALQDHLKILFHPKDNLKTEEDQKKALYLLDVFQKCYLQRLTAIDISDSTESKDILMKCVQSKIEQYRKQVKTVGKSILASTSNATQARPEVEDIMHRLANMM